MLYLKYRPQKIDELDLKSIRERLTNILSKKQVPHAYLFSGPQGAGKTSAARIVAKVVNCKARSAKWKTEVGSEIDDKKIKKSKNQKIKPQSARGANHTSQIAHHTSQIEPCNKCDSCKAIMQGRHLDIIEIDAASNRGIDQIRDLRDKIGLSPSSAKYKVYIIDEVHMLTKEAFNALLKTLEEPPAHAIFILATTEPHRLPATVKSRCVEVPFPKAIKEEVFRSLNRVVKGENIDISKNAMRSIANIVDGSFRDATKILEEISAEGGRIETINLEKYIGASFAQIDRFIDLLEKKEVGELLKFINQNVEDGVDVSWLTGATLNKLHERFLSVYGVESAKKPSLNSLTRGDPLREAPSVKSLAFNTKELVKLMRLFEIAAREEKSAVVAQMPLELAVIEWCQNKDEK